MGCGASTSVRAFESGPTFQSEVERLREELKESQQSRAALAMQLQALHGQPEAKLEPTPTRKTGQAVEKCELLESCEAVVAAQPPKDNHPDQAAGLALETPSQGSQSAGGKTPEEGQSEEENAKVQVDMPGVVEPDRPDRSEATGQLEEIFQDPSHRESIAEKKLSEITSSNEEKAMLESTASTCSPTLQKPSCGQCFCEAEKLYVDPNDLNRYCESCWVEYYGNPPQSNSSANALVPVEGFEPWSEDILAEAWSEQILPGWPPMTKMDSARVEHGEEVWTKLSIRVRRDVCGGHAREQMSQQGLASGEVLAQRYRMVRLVGEGHFTKAYLAEDQKEHRQVCIKRHRNLPIEALADFFVVAQRLHEVDRGGRFFPVLQDAFFDLVGYTVESMLEGKNCSVLATENPAFFHDLANLRLVAFGVLSGLMLLDKAGIVHNDIKPDNLIWTKDGGPRVKIVDFGCARIDQREKTGLNWALAEGGAGHLGKWSPEMTLRLPIGHRSDIWGAAVSLCELHCGRVVWRSEVDSAEVVMAQALGLCNLRDGLPASLLRRSPLDVRQLYTPAPRHWPLRRAAAHLEAVRPKRWGLDQILGPQWQDSSKVEFGEFLLAALVLDPAFRLSAEELLECCSFLNPEVLQ